MTNKARIKANVSAAFRENRYSSAFEALFSIEPYEVSLSLEKNKWLSNTEASNFFWKIFCIDNAHLVFGERFAQIILNWYLRDLKNLNEPLNALLVKSYSKQFMTAIKRNRSFLNPEFNEKTKLLVWPVDYNLDILAQIELEKLHSEKLGKIDVSYGFLSSLSLHEILCGLINSLDKRYYLQNDGKEEKLFWIYNFALSYLSTKKIKTSDVDQTDFEKIFGKVVGSSHQNMIDNFVDAIEAWLDFETTILTSYCFDDNFEATLKDGRLHLDFKSEEEYKKWERDVLRYTVNEMRYLKLAAHYYEYLKSEKKINIPGKNEEHIDENLHLFLHEQKVNLLLKDLVIDKFKLDDQQFESAKILSALIGYSKNRQVRYVRPMLELTQSNTPWLSAVIKVAHQSVALRMLNTPFPFMYMRLEDLKNIYKSAMDNLDETEFSAMMNFFSQDFNENASFNPFKLRYNMLETPLLKIGNYVLMPTTPFAMNNWFFSFSQRALHVYAGKDHIALRNSSSQEMEKLLLSEFQNKGWYSRCVTQQEANNIDGDIDLFVNDGKTQLLIQLKRTKLKLDLESNYYDSLVIDLKASGQLNAAVDSLQNNVIRELEIMDNSHLWIVTTSFEGILTNVDGCKKVNYFDLLWAIRFASIKSIDELVDFITSDKPFLYNLQLLEMRF